MADLNAWRALVDKELAGAPFDKLVQRTPEGIAIQPLYTGCPAEPPPPGVAPFVRGAASSGWRLCMRVDRGADLTAELDGGADALWCGADDRAALDAARDRGLMVVVDGLPDNVATVAWSSAFAGSVVPDAALVQRVRATLEGDRADRCLRVSGVSFHDAGADAADEIALILSSLVAVLRALDTAGVALSDAARCTWAQIAIGRDTFGEVCKLRALRVVWHKVLAAAGVADGRLDAIHAVCAARTLSTRDPWVNMLRVTTQVFAAALGGAQLVTPQPFDAAFAARSPLGQRIARNTALVLRDESQLGRVIDAGGGSFYLETRTDALAREAWSRFQAIERDGGIAELLRGDTLRVRLEAAWAERAAAIARRKEPVLGVSEFANLREQLPSTPAPAPGVHRDAEAFEALRARVEPALPDVALVLLGPPSEHRARVGFAESLFAVAGLAARSRELAAAAGADVACLCGSDDRYAAEAAQAARALKATGVRRVVLAGRPGALEAELRAAGVDAFIFVGCDVVATLEDVLA